MHSLMRSSHDGSSHDGSYPPINYHQVWTSQTNPTQSIGFMECSGLGASHQVIFRCPCMVKEACGEQEKIVAKLASEGKMPMQDW